MFRRLCAGLAPALLLFCCAAARADISLGGDARAIGMGGAGLASAVDGGGSNPSALADTGARFALEMPNITTRMTGFGYSDVFKLLGSPTLSAAKAFDLAKDLANGTPRLDVAASAGVLLPQADVRVQASLRAEVRANAAYRQLISGGPIDPSAKADVIAGGLAMLPSVGLGMRLPMREDAGTLAVGARLKPTRAYYSHYVIDPAAFAAGTPALAAEMGGKTYLSTTTFSMDAGLTYTLPHLREARMALVVNNLIEPKAVNAGPVSVQLAPRTVSAGVALENGITTLAADLVDLTRAQGNTQLRLGTETRLGLLALRGGYNSSTGFTAGLGLGGFGLAFSQRAPIMLSHSVAF